MIISEGTMKNLYRLDIVLSIVICVVLWLVNPDIGFWTAVGIIVGLSVFLVGLPQLINAFSRRRQGVR